MTRLVCMSLLCMSLLGLLGPAIADAEPAYRMVYRTELRTVVLVPIRSSTPPMAVPVEELIARHRAMGATHRVHPNTRVLADPADHFERRVAQLQRSQSPQP